MNNRNLQSQSGEVSDLVEKKYGSERRKRTSQTDDIQRSSTQPSEHVYTRAKLGVRCKLFSLAFFDLVIIIIFVRGVVNSTAL